MQLHAGKDIEEFTGFILSFIVMAFFPVGLSLSFPASTPSRGREGGRAADLNLHRSLGEAAWDSHPNLGLNRRVGVAGRV